MKRYLLPSLLFFMFGIFSPLASFAEGDRSITILCTGAVKGNFEARSGKGAFGGLALRAEMIESIRTDKKSVLLLDSGAVFDPQKDHANAELHLKAMERMGYDALNLASPELAMGKEFLERSRSLVSFPYIASNLLYKGGKLPWIREYVIKEVGGIKVAILGVIDPEDFRKISSPVDVKGFEVMPPEGALNKLLPGIRGKADLVVLLSQLGELGEMKLFKLLDAVRGIDVAVFSEKNYAITPSKKDVGIVHTGINGITIGLATVTLDDQGVRSASEKRNVQQYFTVPDKSEIQRLIETYKKEQERQKKK